MRVRKALPVVAVSDLHVGCEMALMPKSGWERDGGQMVMPSPLQSVLADWWDEAWKWVEKETGGQYDVVVNGDFIDGVHHHATTPWTTNVHVQRDCCRSLLQPIRDRARRMYVIRGTEAHVGQSGEHEEAIAKSIKADRPDGAATFSQWEMFYRVGEHLAHFAHHIGTSSSPFSETSALLREQVGGYVEAGRWGDEPAAVYVRSHRHICSGIWHPSRHGITSTVTTPAWQLKTPYVHKIPARMSQPQIGLVLILVGDNGPYIKPWVKHIERPKEVRP